MRQKLPPNLGLKLAAVWLIITGVVPIVNLSFAGLPIIMAALAIAAGVLILMER